jgi:hypothetical protein
MKLLVKGNDKAIDEGWLSLRLESYYPNKELPD